MTDRFMHYGSPQTAALIKAFGLDPNQVRKTFTFTAVEIPK